MEKEGASSLIESIMREKRAFNASDEFKQKANINKQKYEEMYNESIQNSQKFWAEQAQQLNWIKPWEKIMHQEDGPFYKWFVGGKLNTSYNCLDRHIKTSRKNKVALIWEGEPEEEQKTYTYLELYREVCRFANVLKKHGIKKGDRVCIYLPMLPELPISMLACARIGAIHSVVFGGFSAQALRERIDDCQAKMLITSDASIRNGKKIPLKADADKAIEGCEHIQKVIVVNRGHLSVDWKQGRDLQWENETRSQDISDECPPEEMDSEDSLFILYTSGTTGKPKGILHTTAGYILYAQMTFKYVFDNKEEDIYWCTADIGWITGHTYTIYGPLLNGATTLLMEGTPMWPNPDRFWKIVDKYKVNVFYTAPTAIRALQREGDEWVKKHNLKSLRLLGSVGEPINPEAWMWYYKIVGQERCPIVDTWWQTETGGVMITPIPGAMPMKPGSACRPFFGVLPEIVREDGSKADVNEGGNLVIKKPWPSMVRTVWGSPERYKETYFSKYGDSIYFTGDGAKIDEDGYFWLMGRIDDVVKVSGHRLGTAEIESAIVSFVGVAEAAVVPYPHNIKGNALYAFVTLKKGTVQSGEMKEKIRQHVAQVVGSIAKPDKIQFAVALPKTRSGKIMRRILKSIAEGKESVGDVTTLADPSVVEKIKSEREK